MDFAKGQRAEVGKRGEDLALEFLESRSMRLVARNWRCGHKELDLIMYDGKFLRIVEVRSLYYPNVQRPAESINRKKKTLVMRAARRFVSLHKIKNEIAFDVVSDFSHSYQCVVYSDASLVFIFIFIMEKRC